jgi:AdoMet-dependent rRNA methyltransferase SPB1
LERLNAEAASRTKRERRRANEIKAKTIQRMQLQMTTPLDIGMEQQDAALVLGQDDVFDLVQAENTRGINDDDNAVNGSDDDEIEGASSESDAVLDSDQEREEKVMGLEAELDGLYDAYQGRLRERDAKYKIMEARRKNTEREEWYGIQEERDDDDDSSVGGWDEKDGSDLSEDSESDDESETSLARGRKRPHNEDNTSHSSKRPRLVTKLEGPKIPVSKAAQVWFSQDVFAGIDGADVISEDEDENENGLEEYSDDDDMSVDEHSQQSHSGAAVRTTNCLIF